MMYHVEFYRNQTTNATTYSWKEAMQWKQQGYRVFHYSKDGTCYLI